MSPTVVSALAESSQRQVMETLGSHKAAVLAIRRRRGIGYRRLVDEIALIDPQRQATLVRLLSVVESFTVELLITSVEAQLYRADVAFVRTEWSGALAKQPATGKVGNRRIGLGLVLTTHLTGRPLGVWQKPATPWRMAWVGSRNASNAT